MENEILQIKNYIDGVNDELFFDADNPVTITAYEYTANRMGSVTLSASFMYPKMLDDYWDGTQYVEFQGEKYYVNQVPTSSKDNTDERYKYEVDFVSERKVLESVYFFDVVTDETEQDKYQSNSSKVIFYGDINEFAKRLNYSLKYSNLDYTVVVDEGVTSAERQVSFEDKFMYDALQEIYNTYNVPFYFDGKTIHIGYTNNAIAIPFAYGFDRELLSITKTNANYKIVNRCTGTGSSDNIPYYYPNPSENREAVGDAWITPSTTLMPPIYRQSGGAERFYNAVNDTYPRPDGGYYTFENEYKGNNPKEQIVTFDDIKPTIVEVTNANGDRIDMIAEFAYDSDDNDDVDAETGDHLHPYFYARLRKMDGEWGFNLFEHAITANTPMTISMTSGNCASCNFEIYVVEKVVDGKEVFQNPVQVDSSGNIVAGSYADKVKPDNIQPQQQDTSTNSVWIALKKDINTFGTIMPSVNNNYKPSAGDTFVILYIELPQAYIDAAEKKLEENIIAYMLDNNSTKFNFSINFSQVYFAEHPDTLALMNENARLIIEYNNRQYTLYISSYSYKVTDDSPLPTITVDLADTLSIRKSSLETAIDSIKGDLTAGGFGDILAQGSKYFLRKDIDDETKGKLISRKGFDVGRFSSLVSGGTFRLDAEGKSFIETDRLYVRLKAYFENLEIKKITHVGGEQMITPASLKCNKVEEYDDYYRCYFLKEQDGKTINNEFQVGDQAICKETNLETGSQQSNHYYWRLVVGVGENYIDLSKTDCDRASDEPAQGDDIVQLGNRDDITRQNAIILSSVSLDAPTIKFLQGINSYDLTDKDIISQGFDTANNRAYMKILGDLFAGNVDMSSYLKYDPVNGLEVKGKIVSKGGEDLTQIVDDLSYLKDALQQDTIIEGGLISTSVISTGFSKDGKFTIKGGLNGIYKEDALGSGISYWAGGSPIDRFEYSESEIPKDYARALIRMDGTGYLAKGNIYWDETGKIHADPLSFFVGEETVGDVLAAFRYFKENDELKVIEAQATLTSLGDVIAYSDYAGDVGADMYPVSSTTTYGIVKIDGNTIKMNASGQLYVDGDISGGGGIDFTVGTGLEMSVSSVLSVKYGTVAGTACQGNDTRLSDARRNPYYLSWTGYSNGSYDGSTSKSLTIPSNTDQLTNGAGFIVDRNKNFTSLQGSGNSSQYLAGNGRFYTISHSEIDGLSSNYVTLSTTQTITGQKTYTNTGWYNGVGLLKAGPSSNVHIQLGAGSGNVINGLTSSEAIGNLYFNYQSGTAFTRVDASNNLITTGDVIAYADGGSYASGLPVADTYTYGLIKYDGTTIGKNSSGQLYVINAGSGGGGADVSWGAQNQWSGEITINGTTYKFIKSEAISATANYTSGTNIGNISIGGNVKTFYVPNPTKIGTSTIGASDRPIYLSSGSPTACSSTKGSASLPVYMSSGTITACTGSSIFSSMSVSGSTLYVTVAGQRRSVTLPSSGGSTITSVDGLSGGTINGNVSVGGATYSGLSIRRSSSYYWNLHLRSDNTLYFAYNGTSSHKMSLTSGGALYITGALTQNSDIRLKTVLGNVNNVLDHMLNVRIFRYYLNDDPSRVSQIGFSAQEVLQYWPDNVGKNDGYYTLNYAGMGAIAFQGVKELYTRFLPVENKVKILESRVQNLQLRLDNAYREIFELKRQMGGAA